MLRQSTSDGINADSGTREDSLDMIGLSQMSDFVAKKSVIEHLSKRGSVMNTRYPVGSNHNVMLT